MIACFLTHFSRLLLAVTMGRVFAFWRGKVRIPLLYAPGAEWFITSERGISGALPRETVRCRSGAWCGAWWRRGRLKIS